MVERQIILRERVIEPPAEAKGLFDRDNWVMGVRLFRAPGLSDHPRDGGNAAALTGQTAESDSRPPWPSPKSHWAGNMSAIQMSGSKLASCSDFARVAAAGLEWSVGYPRANAECTY